jgi:hypothetical protein
MGKQGTYLKANTSGSTALAGGESLLGWPQPPDRRGETPHAGGTPVLARLLRAGNGLTRPRYPPKVRGHWPATVSTSGGGCWGGGVCGFELAAAEASGGAWRPRQRTSRGSGRGAGGGRHWLGRVPAARWPAGSWESRECKTLDAAAKGGVNVTGEEI